MADAEDDAEFGSHILASMLEVQMTEEDSELNISKNRDPAHTLPPVPMFDLHSETLAYKDVYSMFSPPVLPTLPLASSTPTTVPLVLKPSPMVVYSGEAVPSRPAPVITSIRSDTSKPIATRTEKPATKNVKVGVGVKSAPEAHETFDSSFLKQVFLPEFVTTVFVKAEPASDVASVSDEEMKYYINCFKDVSKVQSCRLHCTICDVHLGCAVTVRKKINVHSMLKVLTCKPCFEFYGDGNFPCDKGDNYEIYCRWCGQGGALVCCSFCPRVFCKKCVKRNFGLAFFRKIERATDWACFCCAQKPLWPHRAICRALLEFIERRKTDSNIPLRDTTTCCNIARGLTKKRPRVAVDKSKPTAAEPQVKFSPPVRMDVRSKTYTSPKTVSSSSFAPVKANDRMKARVNSTPKPKTITNIFSPRSIITGNNIIRGIATSSTPKMFSTFPSPQVIQSPVVRSEPLIHSSPRILVQAKPPGNSDVSSSCVKVSLTHQAPSLDVSKIPTVKVPQLVQGLFLRLIFPDNKMQYVRLLFEGTRPPAAENFRMPQFRVKQPSFVEENLAEAFKISKMMYEKMLRTKEQVSCRNKLTEKSVFNSSVKKLHLDYENIIGLYKELDRTLLENHEKWKNERKNPVDVIDLSDDEGITAKRSKPNRCSNAKEARKNANEDSDIEILDDVTVNGKTHSSNFKEKYRLRSSGDQGKLQGNQNVFLTKKKRGRPKSTDRRLKVNRMQNGQPEEDPLKLDETAPCTAKSNGKEEEPTADQARPDLSGPTAKPEVAGK